MPHTMILFQKNQILSGKKYWNKFVDVHKICLYSACNFQNQIRNIQEKRQTAM
jgi:hypothetical protein